MIRQRVGSSMESLEVSLILCHLFIPRSGQVGRGGERRNTETERAFLRFPFFSNLVEPKDLGDLRFAYIQLTICKSRIKYGAPLG